MKIYRLVHLIAVPAGLAVLAVAVSKINIISQIRHGADGAPGIGMHPVGATAQVDFSGHRITVVVPSSEGGTLDTYVRVIAPALIAELPGSPSLVIQNIPGSGTMAGANQFEVRADPDGLTLLGVTTTTYLNYVFGRKAAKYSLDNYIPITVSPQGVVVYVRPEVAGEGQDPIQSARDHGKMIFGGHSPTSAELRHLVAFDLLGIDIKGVWGLASGPRRLAFLRGEIQINLDSASSFLNAVKPMIAAGEAVPLFSYGIKQDGKYVRDPIAPDLPTFWEAYEERHGRPLEGIEREVFDTLYATVLANKGLVLPDGTPDNIVEIYRKAMERVLANPEVVAKIRSGIGPYPIYTRKDAEAAHSLATTMSDDVRAWLKVFLSENYPTNF
jgi:tripartite-type tricarboxylate transporter receptor subunit TctC